MKFGFPARFLVALTTFVLGLTAASLFYVVELYGTDISVEIEDKKVAWVLLDDGRCLEQDETSLSETAEEIENH